MARRRRAGERSESVFSTRLTPDERADLEEQAQRRGVSSADLVRQWIKLRGAAVLVVADVIAREDVDELHYLARTIADAIEALWRREHPAPRSRPLPRLPKGRRLPPVGPSEKPAPPSGKRRRLPSRRKAGG